MRKMPFEVVTRVGTLVLALVLLPFLMVVGLGMYIARLVLPRQWFNPAQPSLQTSCQGMAGDGLALPQPGDHSARLLVRDKGRHF